MSERASEGVQYEKVLLKFFGNFTKKKKKKKKKNLTFVKFLRTALLKNICEQLLLSFIQNISYFFINQAGFDQALYCPGIV